MAKLQSFHSAGRAAFAYPDFVRFQLARLCVIIALEMQSVAVGWQIYEITRRPLDLGYVGLAQFLPGVLLFLISGHTADRADRRKLMIACYVGFALCSTALLLATNFKARAVTAIYVVLVLIGVTRAFYAPASRSLITWLVPEEHFTNSVAWGSTVGQVAMLLGPALGGLVYALFRGPAIVYGGAATALVAAAVLTTQMKGLPKSPPPRDISLETVLAGLRYIYRQKLILGSISLDLFAVLFGGAVALLPVYAREILNTGPWGLGLLRSAPAVGAALMAVALAYRPLGGRVGATLLWCVAGFGVFTILFGISRNLILSLFALLMAGACDMVSVIIRVTLLQISTPDEVRGRVTAVEVIFLDASNEFGQFESGVTAQWFGSVPAVILGGIGTLVVTALWAYAFPQLRKADRLNNPQEQSLSKTSAPS